MPDLRHACSRAPEQDPLLHSWYAGAQRGRQFRWAWQDEVGNEYATIDPPRYLPAASDLLIDGSGHITTFRDIRILIEEANERDRLLGREPAPGSPWDAALQRSRGET